MILKTKIMKKILLMVAVLFCVIKINAQQTNFEQLNEKALKAYTSSSIFMWKQLALQANKILFDDNASQESKIFAIKIKYGLLYACLSNQDEETFEQYLEDTENQLKVLMREYESSSELFVISAGIMSIQMGFSPMKGMTLGALSGQHIEKALRLDSLNAMAWRQYASSKYFTPKMWGGDINEAIQKYEHAVSLYEKQNLTNDWTYLDAITWLGIAYQKVGEKEKAEAAYNKALQVASDFGWVKHSLLPSLSKS